MTNEVPEIEEYEEIAVNDTTYDECIGGGTTNKGAEGDIQESASEQIDPVDNISPLPPEVWPSVILLHLQNSHEGNETSEWFKQKVDEVCGEDFDIDTLWLPENQQLTSQIVGDYIDYELENIRRKSFSLNAGDITEAATSLLNISGIKMSVTQFQQLPNDDLLLKRISKIDELKDTYKVFYTGTQFYALSTSSELNRLDIENNVRKTEDLHDTGRLETELLAKCYYNAAVLHEKKICI